MKQKIAVFLTLVFINAAAAFADSKDLMNLDFNSDPLDESYLTQEKPVSQPPQQAPVPGAEYEVGVDDVLDINVIKPETIQSTVTVAPDGTITFPYIGNVYVKGLTLSKIQDEVQKRLSNGYVEFPIVSVSLRQTRSKKFTIYGQVTRPGGYPVEEGMTILRAITDAGGFIVPGSTGRVKILRPKPGVKESEVITFDIAAILNGTDQNVKVLPGDTIVVSVDKFFIYGQVLRPGAYPVEESMTILHAVTLAGGFIESGSTGKVKLFRPKTKDREAQIIESGINAILKGTKQNAVVLSGDTIVVTLDKFYISGQVNRPGAYPVEENMTLLSAVTQAGGFVESGSTGKVKLLRPKAGTKESQAIESDIAAILNGSNQNVAVLPGDSIVVSADKFFVYGEVVRPGMYPLEASASTFTAISMAGGFTKFGAANRVKVMRINEATGAYDQIKVNINDVMAGDSKADVILKPRDIVVVSEGMF